MDPKHLQITNWVNSLFPTEKNSVSVLSGDASFRSYYRVHTNDELNEKTGSYVVMNSEKDPSLNKFIYIAKQLKEIQISAPEILAENKEHGLLLLEDFGDNLYLNSLTHNTCDNLYLDALRALSTMQLNFKEHATLPQFNLDFVKQQLGVFTTWYLNTHLKIKLSSTEEKIIEDFSLWFTEFLNNQPKSFVHLDYHSRNLIVLEKNTPGVLDFQDAMFGPTVYDLVSLFQDAYISWDRSKIEKWLKIYLDMTKNSSLSYKNFNSLLEAFDIIGLQRHLKNLGVFARLYHRDNKSNYLKDIPQLLSYIQETLDKYNIPEIKNIKNLLSDKIPAMSSFSKA